MIPDPRVHSLMQRDVATVSPDATVGAVSRTLADRGFHHLPVVDAGRLVGIVTAHDVARASLDRWVQDRETNEAWLEQVPVREVMSPLPEVLHPEDLLRVAAERLGDGAWHALPVVDPVDHHLVGILTTTDLVRFLYTQLRG